MSNVDTHRRLHELFNSRDFDAMDEHIHADLTYVDQPRGATMKSLDEFKNWLRGWTTAFSDARVADVEYLAGADFTVARFRGQGTNDGQLGPFEPTGGRMDTPFCEVLHFDADGRVHATEMYYDQMTMLTQTGHIQASQ